MSSELDRSYAHCRAVARHRAKNFYYSFLLLPRAQRNAMCAVYAFMRYCDDLSDEPGASMAPLERWRIALDHALAGQYGGDPVLPAFHNTVKRYRIPRQYFHEMIDGVSSDLQPRHILTFDQLYRYCYQVASVVGMTTIHILGFDTPDALRLAEKCGVAFQLTNILRDVREDAERGRIYLPHEDLKRFSVRVEHLKADRQSPEFIALMRFEAARARAYYEAAQPLLGMVHKRSRSSLWALIEVYSRLLKKIEASHFDVLSRRIALSTAEKCWVVLRAGIR